MDPIILVQAAVAGMLLWRAIKEESRWDKGGFSMLAVAAGFMAWRRVTASTDHLSALDAVTLPRIITFVMLASATFFMVEVFHRAKQHGLPIGLQRFFWPFATFLVVAACDALPAQQGTWAAPASSQLSFEDALLAVDYQQDPRKAAERLRWFSSRAVERLSIARIGSTDPTHYDALLRAIRDAADRELKR